MEARPGAEKRCSQSLQSGPVKTWKVVFVIINIFDRTGDQLISRIVTKFMCILSGKGKRQAANLLWILLSASYKGIFDGSDINGDTSVFLINEKLLPSIPRCLSSWNLGGQWVTFMETPPDVNL